MSAVPYDRDRWLREDPELLFGLDLRYVLTDVIHDSGRVWAVRELVDELRRMGFDLGDRPGKLVSDHLRTEVSRDRVRRRGWGRYGPGAMPGATRRRIRTRARLRRDWLGAADHRLRG